MEELEGQDGDRVLHVVDVDKVGDFGVEQARPFGVSDARRAVGDTLDVDARREVQGEEQSVEFGERASQRVADLRDAMSDRDRVRSISPLTVMTVEALDDESSTLTSSRIVAAVCSCSSAKPM